MAMVDAFRFQEVCRTDESFRTQAYLCEGAKGFRKFIAESGYDFNDAEFEDGLRATELRCRDEYEAEEIKQLGQWYRLMTMTEKPAACASCHGASR